MWNVSVLTFAAAFPLALAAQNTQHSQTLGTRATEEISKTLVACLALVGKTFWYIPGVRSEPMFVKPNASGELPSRAFWQGLRIANETSFVVVDCTTNEGKDISLFKVAFPDKSFGYLATLDYAERRSDEFSVMGGMYPGIEKGYFGLGTTSAPLGYVYAGPPQEVFDSEKKIAAEKEIKAAAAMKARGGVRIGMGTAQALKSNWGPPQKINRTITIRGQDEQWVYGDQNYLYFRNGILIAIQN